MDVEDETWTYSAHLLTPHQLILYTIINLVVKYLSLITVASTLWLNLVDHVGGKMKEDEHRSLAC